MNESANPFVYVQVDEVVISMFIMIFGEEESILRYFSDYPSAIENVGNFLCHIKEYPYLY